MAEESATPLKTVDLQTDPLEAQQRPMSQGGLSSWIRSKQEKADVAAETQPKYKKTHVDYYVVL